VSRNSHDQSGTGSSGVTPTTASTVDTTQTFKCCHLSRSQARNNNSDGHALLVGGAAWVMPQATRQGQGLPLFNTVPQLAHPRSSDMAPRTADAFLAPSPASLPSSRLLTLRTAVQLDTFTCARGARCFIPPIVSDS
jgi:hypothetical protein